MQATVTPQVIERRWGHPADPIRLEACALHIAAGHLVYNATIGDRVEGDRLLAHIDSLGMLDH